MDIRLVSADIDDGGVARLVARDDRLGLETVVYAVTDGDRWCFAFSRRAADERLRDGLMGPQIHHSQWMLAADA